MLHYKIPQKILKCKRRVNCGVNSKESDPSHRSMDSAIYKSDKYSVSDCYIKNEVKTVKDIDMTGPSQHEVKILRKASETDPSHGLIETVAYKANEYSTKDLNFKDGTIIVKDLDETAEHKLQLKNRNIFRIPGRWETFEQVATKLKGPFDVTNFSWNNYWKHYFGDYQGSSIR